MSQAAIDRVRRAYVGGEIDVAEMERRIACLLGLEEPEPEPCPACAAPELGQYIVGCAECGHRHREAS